MKVGFDSTLFATRHSYGSALFAGMVILIVTSAPAQNIFVGDLNSIHEFTPGGVQYNSIPISPGAGGLAFDSAGNLFEADYNSGNIYKFTPGGVQSTFATGLAYPQGLAFDSAGNLFEADTYTGYIYK